MFVANRVQHIRSRTDPSQWRHAHSAENPADEASRGISADEFLRNSKWLRGPDFLWEQNIQEKEEVLDTEEPQNELTPRFERSKYLSQSATISRLMSAILNDSRAGHICV